MNLELVYRGVRRGIEEVSSFLQNPGGREITLGVAVYGLYQSLIEIAGSIYNLPHDLSTGIFPASVTSTLIYNRRNGRYSSLMSMATSFISGLTIGNFVNYVGELLTKSYGYVEQLGHYIASTGKILDENDIYVGIAFLCANFIQRTSPQRERSQGN